MTGCPTTSDAPLSAFKSEIQNNSKASIKQFQHLIEEDVSSIYSYRLLTDWLDRYLIPPLISHLSDLSAFGPGLLQVLYSADIDGCTVHIPCTQAENSTWHFPGARSEAAAEMEHFCADRQVRSLAHDVTKSGKPVAIKIPQNQTLPRNKAKLTQYSLKPSLPIKYQAPQNRLTRTSFTPSEIAFPRPN